MKNDSLTADSCCYGYGHRSVQGLLGIPGGYLALRLARLKSSNAAKALAAEISRIGGTYDR